MDRIPPAIKQHFYQQVWELVRQVPAGRVATYGQIGKLIPLPEGVSNDDYKMSAARWAGMALSACPDDVPWQRVINSQGKISHRAEAGKQKQLLQSEGVLFVNEKISLHEYQWHGPGQGDQPAHCDAPAQGQLF